MKWTLTLIAILFSTQVAAKHLNNFARPKNEPVKIAVVDTGLDLTDPRFKNVLCKEGHEDFTGMGINDVNSHGTHIAGLIKKYAGDSNYCLVILKWYHNSQISSTTVKAFIKAIRLNAKIVNYSAGGPEIPLEKHFIERFSKIKFVVAAGNEGTDIGKTPYYPCAYDFQNIECVGNMTLDGTRNPSSNYGVAVRAWEVGTDVVSHCINNQECKMSGTSQATAIRTGKLIKELYGKRN